MINFCCQYHSSCGRFSRKSQIYKVNWYIRFFNLDIVTLFKPELQRLQKSPTADKLQRRAKFNIWMALLLYVNNFPKNTCPPQHARICPIPVPGLTTSFISPLPSLCFCPCSRAGRGKKLHILRVRPDVCPPVMTHFYVVCALCYQKSINSRADLGAASSKSFPHQGSQSARSLAAAAWPPLTPKMCPRLKCMDTTHPVAISATLGEAVFPRTRLRLIVLGALYVLHRLVAWGQDRVMEQTAGGISIN